MNKNQELQILDRAIDQLGRDSYIGPWLEEVRDSVEQDIKSDIFPFATMASTKAECDRMLAKAEEERERIIREARIAAERILTDAGRRVEVLKAGMRTQIAQAAKVLDGWA